MPKIAIVHDYLIKLGGAERVLKTLMEVFPEAPIFTLLYDEKKVGHIFPKEKIHPSFLQKIPAWMRKKNKLLLPLLPTATEQLDLEAYDIIISSSGAYSHGIITNSQSKHFCYCHSPMRYIWDWKDEYLEENQLSGLKKLIAQKLLHSVRIWDQTAADRVDHYIANSRTVQKRIKKYYRQDASVIYPPVNIDRFTPTKEHADYFLIVSTLTPYKKIDIAVEVFNKIQRKLIIIGDGPQMKELKRVAGDTIELLGFKSDEVVAEYMQNCRAFIFPGEDDFGIAPVEAMACGKPVLAYGKGGATETVIPGKTGEHFYEHTAQSFENGLAKLMLNEKIYNYQEIANHAAQFSEERFKYEMRHAILPSLN